MTPAIRPDVHARFLRVVERGIARADREHAEELARLRLAPRLAPGAAFRGYLRKRPR